MTITRIARLIACCASFGVALAFARHMAQLCASAGTVHSATSKKAIAEALRAAVTSLHPEVNNPVRIREEEEIHDDEACHDRDHQQPAHQGRLKLQVHEVANNQRR